MTTKIEKQNDTYSITFKVSLGFNPFGNTVEIFLNNNNLDELRGSDDKCYHKLRECNPKHCVCSTDSQIYILKHEMSTSTPINSFGCRIRYQDKNLHRLMKKEIHSLFQELRK